MATTPKLTRQAQEARAARLGQLADRIAELLDIDPELIQFDIQRNQLCLLPQYVERLLAEAGAR